jgi:hypothetical protein
VSDTLLGVIIGGVLTTTATLVVELIRAGRESALDKQKRADNRRIDRDVFQRQTLLELQEAVNEVARAAFQVHHHDLMSSQSSGKWGGVPLPADVNDADRLGRLRMSTLQSRVVDDEVRRLATALTAAAAAVAAAKDATAADQAINRVAHTARQAIERSGELIRATF